MGAGRTLFSDGRAFVPMLGFGERRGFWSKTKPHRSEKKCHQQKLF